MIYMISDIGMRRNANGWSFKRLISYKAATMAGKLDKLHNVPFKSCDSQLRGEEGIAKIGVC